MWILALLAAAAVAAAKKTEATTPRTVELKAGSTYRIKFKVLRASPPMTREAVDGLKQGLELAGMRDVRVTYGANPTVEYTQTSVVSVTMKIGEEVTLSLGEKSITILYLWARETSNAPNV